jgi:hypothetical protein
LDKWGFRFLEGWALLQGSNLDYKESEMGDDWHEFFEDHPEYAPEPERKPHPLEQALEQKRRANAREVQDLVNRALKEHPPKR